MAIQPRTTIRSPGGPPSMAGTVWTSGNCASWYLDESGRNTTLWPSFTWRFLRETRRFDPAAYHFGPAVSGSEPLAEQVA